MNEHKKLLKIKELIQESSDQHTDNSLLDLEDMLEISRKLIEDIWNQCAEVTSEESQEIDEDIQRETTRVCRHLASYRNKKGTVCANAMFGRYAVIGEFNDGDLVALQVGKHNYTIHGRSGKGLKQIFATTKTILNKVVLEDGWEF